MNPMKTSEAASGSPKKKEEAEAAACQPQPERAQAQSSNNGGTERPRRQHRAPGERVRIDETQDLEVSIRLSTRSADQQPPQGTETSSSARVRPARSTATVLISSRPTTAQNQGAAEPRRSVPTPRPGPARGPAAGAQRSTWPMLPQPNHQNLGMQMLYAQWQAGQLAICIREMLPLLPERSLFEQKLKELVELHKLLHQYQPDPGHYERAVQQRLLRIPPPPPPNTPAPPSSRVTASRRQPPVVAAVAPAENAANGEPEMPPKDAAGDQKAE